MATKFVKATKPTVLRVVEDDREVSRRVKAGDGPFEIPADDFPGLKNAGRVEEVEAPADRPSAKAKARARSREGRGAAPAKLAAAAKKAAAA